jgi:VIT1/CCC1 family predicted Fe2+/Mn2+ transporter
MAGMHMSLRPSRWRRPVVGAESIREVVFGVEDGVVQNMTLIAGMVGAALSNSVILLAGTINAIAGVLSMSMGTFLSSKAEQDVKMVAPHGAPRISNDELLGSPKSDALVMAGAYAAGAAVPLVPFVVGAVSTGVALAIAVMLTAATLFGLGAAKAVVSHQSRVRSGLEMLILASAAGLAGYALGALARAVFGLDA